MMTDYSQHQITVKSVDKHPQNKVILWLVWNNAQYEVVMKFVLTNLNTKLLQD